MRATARRRSLTKQLRSLPDVFDTRNRVPREVMGADEKRIVMQNLRSRRFVVGVVQTDQRIPQEWAELAARLLHLLGRTGLDHPSQIRAHLQFGVTVVVNSRRPLRSLTTAKNRTRHFKFPKPARQRNQIVSLGSSMRHGLQTIA